jgi:hypothetical protein
MQVLGHLEGKKQEATIYSAHTVDSLHQQESASEPINTIP